MKRVICASVLSACVFMACNKKEPVPGEGSPGAAGAAVKVVACGKEIVADKPVKAGETGIMLPAGTRLCVSADQMEIRVTLPAGFSFESKGMSLPERTLPIYATYSCGCSVSGSACNVFYMDGIGFGCLQSSCTGSCTGRFTYKGYSVERVAVTMGYDQFFALPEVQKLAAEVSITEDYREFVLYGVKFSVVNNERVFLDKATCDCEGTQACKLKVINMPLLKGETTGKKIYYCAGSCNDCELTV